jgi:hypothetical protein
MLLPRDAGSYQPYSVLQKTETLSHNSSRIERTVRPPSARIQRKTQLRRAWIRRRRGGEERAAAERRPRQRREVVAEPGWCRRWRAASKVELGFRVWRGRGADWWWASGEVGRPRRTGGTKGGKAGQHGGSRGGSRLTRKENAEEDEEGPGRREEDEGGKGRALGGVL